MTAGGRVATDRRLEGAPARILAAVDGSDESLLAVAQAAALAKATEAELNLVTVMRDPSDDQPALRELTRGGFAPYLISYLSSDADRLLSRARDQAETCGAAAANCQTRVGDPAQQILEFARELSADLIVVGNRGRGPLKGLLLGSVAQKLLSLATCPVLLACR